MNLRQLEIFVAVAETGSFSRAAEDVLLTQSTVSQHIAALENELGVRLFEQSLLPDATFNAEAALSAYQAALESLTTLMRARITEYELQLDYSGLLGEILKTRARLAYLQGERP